MDDLSLTGQKRDNLVPAGMQRFSSKWKTVLKWLQSPTGKTHITEAEKDAWVPFNRQFPNADKSKFVSQAMVESKDNVSAEIFFQKSPGNLQSVFGSDRKYWSAGMKQVLSLEDSGGFPYQLSALGTKVSLPIPAAPFKGKAPSLKKIFNAEIKIYVTPDQHFTTKFREIFQKTKLRCEVQRSILLFFPSEFRSPSCGSVRNTLN